MKVALFFIVASILSIASCDLLSTASERTDLSSFIGLLESANITDVFNTTTSITLFAPMNSAFNSSANSTSSSTNSSSESSQNGMNSTSMQDDLLYHFHSGILQTGSFVNDELITTLDPRNNTLRTNVYTNNTGGTIYTVNGARIIDADIMASNGVLQVIDKFLIPPNQTVYESLSSNTSFSIFFKLLETAGFLGELNNTVTVFAPTNAAFMALNMNFTSNSTLLVELLNYHIISSTFFTAGLYDGEMLTTLSSLNINITVEELGIIINNKSKIIYADWIQLNGVIQVIDQVLIPPLTIYEINQLEGLTSLNNALVSVGLASDLNNPSAGPFTEFAPTNAAFNVFLSANSSISGNSTSSSVNSTVSSGNSTSSSGNSTTNSTSSSNETLSNILMYHLLTPTVLRVEQFQNEQLLPTMLSGAYVRTNVYNLSSVQNNTNQNGTSSTGSQNSTTGLNGTSSTGLNTTSNQTLYTVNCAVVTISDLVARNGIVQVINKVMVPPTTDALTYINTNANLSEFASLIASANFTLNITNPVTVFAPNNDAIRALSTSDSTNLRSNQTLLMEVILNHFVAGTQCSASLVSSRNLTTLEGNNLNFSSTAGTVLIDNHALIVVADVMQFDGVIQVIDSVLITPSSGIPVPPTPTGVVTTGSTGSTGSPGVRLAAFSGLIGLLCLAFLL